jgi:transglutaminase-like putative cysteine protease
MLLRRIVTSIAYSFLLAGFAVPPLESTSELIEVRVSFTMRYKITAEPGTESVELDVLIPQSRQGRQTIHDIRFSHQPAQSFAHDGCSYAQFLLDYPPKTTEIVITVDATIHRYDCGMACSSRNCPRLGSTADLDQFLVHEEYLEKDAPELRQLARKLLGKSDKDSVLKTMAFVVATLRQGPFDSADHGALWALEKKQGDCTEFTDLFVALCRANNLPAKFCQGYLIHDVVKGDTPKHDWAEVYLPEYGWVPFDPFHAHQGNAVEEMLPIYLYLDNQRRNSLLNDGHYYAYYYQGDSVLVEDSFTIVRREVLPPK